MTTTTQHDVRDRRHTNMEDACQKLANCVADLHYIAGDDRFTGATRDGLNLLVADRIARIAGELALFRARDLLNMREVSV